MTASKTRERLEPRLHRLIENMLVRKKDQVTYLSALNRLDDVIIDQEQGKPIVAGLEAFLKQYRDKLETTSLSRGQKKQLSDFLSKIFEELRQTDDGDTEKLAVEIREWLHDLGDGGFRITLKKPAEKASLADRFQLLMKQEIDEMRMQLGRCDHLLTCLDDILKSAETKTDRMYQHLAATIIYFLQMEGYKVDPYVKRLKRLRLET